MHPSVMALSTALILTLSSAAAAEAPAKAVETLPTDGFSGALHKQLAGNIAFSNAPIAADAASNAPLRTEFDLLKDPIYLRPFLANSLENLLGQQG